MHETLNQPGTMFLNNDIRVDVKDGRHEGSCCRDTLQRHVAVTKIEGSAHLETCSRDV